MGRAPCCEKVGLKRGRWTAEEDATLTNYIQTHGEGSWRSLPKNAGLLRCGKSCRLRWINYLRSDLKRGNISADEEEIITKLHATLGNRWSLIVGHLPGRTDNEIKNYWNSHLSRKIHTSGRPNTSLSPDLTRTIITNKRRGGHTSHSAMKINKTSLTKPPIPQEPKETPVNKVVVPIKKTSSSAAIYLDQSAPYHYSQGEIVTGSREDDMLCFNDLLDQEALDINGILTLAEDRENNHVMLNGDQDRHNGDVNKMALSEDVESTGVICTLSNGESINGDNWHNISSYSSSIDSYGKVDWDWRLDDFIDANYKGVEEEENNLFWPWGSSDTGEGDCNRNELGLERDIDEKKNAMVAWLLS